MFWLMQAFSEVYPHLRTATDVPTLVKIADVDWDQVDAAFCCLPHATTQETLAQLPKHIKIVDLSADFRLKNVDTYAEWYNQCPVLHAAVMHCASYNTCLIGTSFAVRRPHAAMSKAEEGAKALPLSCRSRK